MIKIYGLSSGCPKCEQAKNLINMYGYTGKWEYIELDKAGNECFSDMVKSDGFRSAPAVYVDSEKLGSVNELQSFLLDWRKTT